jgi:cation transport regulator
MPYKKVDDLPNSLLNTLPRPATEIYRKAYNSAWDEYEDPASRHDDASREETSHKVAWGAVKNKYEKKDGKWILKKETAKSQ